VGLVPGNIRVHLEVAKTKVKLKIKSPTSRKVREKWGTRKIKVKSGGQEGPPHTGNV